MSCQAQQAVGDRRPHSPTHAGQRALHAPPGTLPTVPGARTRCEQVCWKLFDSA